MVDLRIQLIFGKLKITKVFISEKERIIKCLTSIIKGIKFKCWFIKPWYRQGQNDLLK